MKKKGSLLVLLLFLAGQLFAQHNNRTTLRIRLSDGYPLTVAVNGRYFQKVGKTLTIGDLPKKRHNIKVYRYRAYQDGNGGKAELVYSGRIKVNPGSAYDCIVDVGTRKFRMKEVASLAEPVMMAAPQTSADIEMPPADIQRSAPLKSLKQKIDASEEDADKLKLAKGFLAANNVSVSELRDIASWFFFDDTRLEFVKQAYPKVADKQAFASLRDVFTLESSKQDFEQFLNSK